MKRKKEFENSVIHLTNILNKLKTKINGNEEYNQAYNRLIIERAVLRKKLTDIKNAKKNNIIQLFKNNYCLNFKNKKKLICDYFSSK